MSARPPPSPGLDIHASRQPSLYAANIVTWILAVIAVCLRFWCRILTKSGYKLDDWLVVAATLISLGQFVLLLVWIHQGYGLHLWVLGPDYLENSFKALWTGELLYTFILCLAKYSILAFYWRIFASAIKIPVCIVAGFVTAWGISVNLVTIFQCRPISAFWNHNVPTVCTVSEYAFFIGKAVPNIITDAAILALPLPFIFRLQRTDSQRIGLAGTFMLGGFVIILSIVRLVALVQVDLKSPDLTWNFALVGVWTATEGNMAIVGACLPSLRPILSLIMTGSPNPSYHLHNTSDQRYSSNSFSKKTKKSRNPASCRSQGVLIDEDDSQRAFAPLVQGLSRSKSFATRAEPVQSENDLGPDIELQGMKRAYKGIRIRRDVDVDYSPPRV